MALSLSTQRVRPCRRRVRPCGRPVSQFGGRPPSRERARDDAATWRVVALLRFLRAVDRPQTPVPEGRPGLRRRASSLASIRCIPRKSLAPHCTKCNYGRRRPRGGLSLERSCGRPKAPPEIGRGVACDAKVELSRLRLGDSGDGSCILCKLGPALFGDQVASQSSRLGTARARTASTTSVLASA